MCDQLTLGLVTRVGMIPACTRCSSVLGMTETQSAVHTLSDLDQAIDTAMSERDAAALESLLADEFIYTHSNGHAQPKPEVVAAIVQRSDPPRRLLSDVHVELHGAIAVTRGAL